MNLIRKLGWFLKLEKRRYIIGILALSLVSVFNLIPPKVIGNIVDKIEAGTDFDTEVEYEGDLELYFVKFSFSKAGTGFLSDKENQLFLYCNNEFCGVVYLE